MQDLIYNGKLIKRIPNNLSEINLNMGIQIMEALGNEKPDLGTKASIIALLSDQEPDYVIDIYGAQNIDIIYSKLEFNFEKEIIIRFLKTFKLKGTNFGMMNYETMTVREYAEIEFWLNEGEYPFSYLAEMMTIIFRPISRGNRSLKNILRNIYSKIRWRSVSPRNYLDYQIEDPNDKYLKYADDFLEHIDFNFGYGVLNHYMEYKNKLRKEYQILFKTDDQIENELEDEFKAEREKEFADWWGYYHLVNECSENIFERDAWYQKPLREFFKYLSYNKQKSLYDGRTGERS